MKFSLMILSLLLLPAAGLMAQTPVAFVAVNVRENVSPAVR
jgi:hypothetical protein